MPEKVVEEKKEEKEKEKRNANVKLNIFHEILNLLNATSQIQIFLEKFF